MDKCGIGTCPPTANGSIGASKHKLLLKVCATLERELTVLGTYGTSRDMFNQNIEVIAQLAKLIQILTDLPSD